MAVTAMQVLADVQVLWPPGNTDFPVLVRSGSLVAIDPGNADLVAACGGAGNLASAAGAPGDGTTLDSGAQTN
jgi:hypothetical protein